MRIIEERDDRLQREALAALITDPAVLGPLAARWEKDLFASSWCNLVASWCVEHWLKYRCPPGRQVVGYVDEWASRRRDNDPEVMRIRELLATASDEWEVSNGEVDGQLHGTGNAGRLLDRMAKHFNATRLRRRADAVLARLEAGQVDEAVRDVSAFRPVQVGPSSGTDFFTDEAGVLALGDEQGENLFNYPGGGKDFFRHQLTRGSFISFLAPNKSKKSFFLMDAAFRAVRSRKRTAFFVVGDLNKRQFGWRLATRVAGRPRRSPDGKWPYTAKLPISIKRPPKGVTLAQVEWEDEVFDQPLTPEETWQACVQFQRRHVKSKESYFWLQVYPARSVSVADIESELGLKESSGWAADVVVIDYADNLAPLDKRADKRDQINDTWTALSALRQARNCCLLTATQADSESFRKGLLDRQNFTDDRRKLDHVTGCVGINITPEEAEKGLCRLNWVNLRDGDFGPKQVLYVAGCLAVGDPFIVSCF